jgi:hypothetical protein
MMTCAVLRLTAFSSFDVYDTAFMGWVGFGLVLLFQRIQSWTTSLLFSIFLPLRETAVVYFPLSNRVETVS